VIAAVTLKSENAVDFDVRTFLLLIIEVVATAFDAVVLGTLTHIDNFDELVSIIVQGVGPKRVVINAICT
jgi:hypothetical protein